MWGERDWRTKTKVSEGRKFSAEVKTLEFTLGFWNLNIERIKERNLIACTRFYKTLCWLVVFSNLAIEMKMKDRREFGFFKLRDWNKSNEKSKRNWSSRFYWSRKFTFQMIFSIIKDVLLLVSWVLQLFFPFYWVKCPFLNLASPHIKVLYVITCNFLHVKLCGPP